MEIIKTQFKSFVKNFFKEYIEMAQNLFQTIIIDNNKNNIHNGNMNVNPNFTQLISKHGDDYFKSLFFGYEKCRKFIDYCEIDTKSNFINCLIEIFENYQKEHKENKENNENNELNNLNNHKEELKNCSQSQFNHFNLSELLANYINLLLNKDKDSLFELNSFMKDCENIMEILPDKDHFLSTYLKLAINRLDNFNYNNEVYFIEKISKK